MFGIGLGEILLVLFIIFIISPRDIPKVMRKIGQFFGALEKLRNEVADIEKEVRDVAAEVRETTRVVRQRPGDGAGPPSARSGRPGPGPLPPPAGTGQPSPPPSLDPRAKLAGSGSRKTGRAAGRRAPAKKRKTSKK